MLSFILYVFEAKSNESVDGPISFETVRQAGLHPKWLTEFDRALPPQRESHVIVVTPSVSVQVEAAKICGSMKYVEITAVRNLFESVAAVLNEMRAKAIGLEEETLREEIMDDYKRKGLAGDPVHKKLTGKMLNALPIVNTK